MLHKVGIQQIIPPVKTIHGHSTQSIGDFTLILYPFIEGQDGFTHTLTDDQWLTLGKTLRQIHEIDMPLSIKQLVDRAEQLAQILQNGSPQFALCHSDIHGGNVLIDDNTIYIVDWDDPIMAPKERDLMFIGGGIANVWNKPYEEGLFYKSYGNIEINMTILAYYRHERIVEDIAEYGQDLLLTRTKSSINEYLECARSRVINKYF